MSDHSSNAGNLPPAVAVYGATGHTGRFVVRELARRGYTAVAIGRNAATLEAADFPAGVKRDVAALEDPAALERALTGVAAVVNCAGAVVPAALRARGHYLDVTAEQASAQATFERYAAAAEHAGVVVIPAMGFYGGLSDLLVTGAMGDWPRADEARIGIALDS